MPNVAPATGSSSDSETWQKIAAVVASAAGGAAWVSTVGSGIVAVRLQQAGLPVEPVVALMSAEHRFAIGAGYLVVPLLAGFVAFVIDWIYARDPAVDHRKRLKIAVISIAIGAVIAYGAVLLQFGSPTSRASVIFLLEIAALLIAVPATLHLLRREPEDRHRLNERLVVFLAVLGAAGLAAFLGERLRDPAFDNTVIRVEGGAAVTGGYITSTDTAVVVVRRHPIDCVRIEAVPRSLITRISVETEDYPIPENC